MNNSWEETILYSFTNGQDGGYPSGDLVDDGNLFGMTSGGGAYGYGTVYEVVP